MKLVVLDAHTTSNNELTWDGLKDLGELTIYDFTSEDQLIERASDCEILLTNKTRITRSDLNKLPKCKFIGVLATGYDTVDIEAAAERNIPVSVVPTYATPSVAQTVFALLLELCQSVGHHSAAVKEGRWSRHTYNTFWDISLVELHAKTMGFIGFGQIGQAAGRIAGAFGMKVIAYDKYKPPVSGITDFRWVEKGELLECSDVVSLHCPLFPDTQGIINRESLKKMKRTALLINTSRGKLVVEKDLADALNNGWIAGAGLDVLWDEPPAIDNPLFTAKNCFITPHFAWATKEARSRLINVSIENVRAFLNGNPQNVVNNIGSTILS